MFDLITSGIWGSHNLFLCSQKPLVSLVILNIRGHQNCFLFFIQMTWFCNMVHQMCASWRYFILGMIGDLHDHHQGLNLSTCSSWEKRPWYNIFWSIWVSFESYSHKQCMFFNYSSYQSNSLTGDLHFTYSFNRHPTWSYSWSFMVRPQWPLWPSWPLWPFCHMT